MISATMSILSLTSDSISHLRTLVGFNSVSNLSNIPIIDYIENFLRPLGFDCLRVPNADNTKCNFLARIGPEVAGGMVMSGHTDVVPVEGQEWHTEPFT